MKKFTMFLMVILSLAITMKSQAQAPPVATVQILTGFDTTVASYKDTLKNYSYSNVYMIVNSVSLNRGSSFPMMYAGTSQTTTTFENWKANVSVSFYTSKADYTSGKQSITQANVQVELTATYPTQEAILTKLLTALPK